MERKVYVTRLRPEYRQEYIDAHDNIDPALMERYRAAGIRSCSVYVQDDLLILITESEDHAGANAILAADPLDRGWQARVGRMKAGEWVEMTELFAAKL